VAGGSPEITMRWRAAAGAHGGLLFDAGAPGRPSVLVDGDGTVATSPVEMLLVAAATCSASDVVLILQKQRVALETLEVALRGTRREEQPRRYTALHFVFTLSGIGVDETKARRAIDLSLEKYCSVVASLVSDIHVTYDVALR
jgi:putative redox protein